MTRTLLIACALFAGLAIAGSSSRAASDALPSWAYPVNPPGAKPPADDGKPKQLPGTAVTFTLAQTRDAYNVPDWHPDSHPAMPEIVAHGRRPEVRACGYCHLPNGFGRPENASLAGQPAAYIAQQMADYRNGLRKSSEPKMGPPNAMIAVAKGATEAEVETAAAYFASVKQQPWVRVVEAATVPKTHVAGSMFVVDEGGATEPIGHRIVEVPENLSRTELRDATSGFVAYVPPGSIKAGARLVTTGGSGKTIRCGICHGEDLRGLGPVPGIAGRSPSYLVRQLFDMQHGSRHGLGAELMRATVAKLTGDDMIAIAAYSASRIRN